jgi:hypothetical protein
MKGITIAWRDGPITCEFRREASGGWLHLLSGDELVAREPAASVSAAYHRAHELCEAMESKRAKRA